MSWRLFLLFLVPLCVVAQEPEPKPDIPNRKQLYIADNYLGGTILFGLINNRVDLSKRYYAYGFGYKYLLTKSIALRTGVGMNTFRNNFNYRWDLRSNNWMVNVGAEARIRMFKKKFTILLGGDLAYSKQENHYIPTVGPEIRSFEERQSIGVGPMIGFEAKLPRNFSVTTEIAMYTGYGFSSTQRFTYGTPYGKIGQTYRALSLQLNYNF